MLQIRAVYSEVQLASSKLLSHVKNFVTMFIDSIAVIWSVELLILNIALKLLMLA